MAPSAEPPSPGPTALWPCGSGRPAVRIKKDPPHILYYQTWIWGIFLKRLPEHAVFWLLLLLLGLGSAGSLYKKAADQAALKAELPERILAAPVISGPSAVSHAPILFLWTEAVIYLSRRHAAA